MTISRILMDFSSKGLTKIKYTSTFNFRKILTDMKRSIESTEAAIGSFLRHTKINANSRR